MDNEDLAVPQYGCFVAELYHTERHHQGLANRLISPEAGHLGNAGGVQRRQRLGGMLNYYYRAAA
jgi:hypothetical protein